MLPDRQTEEILAMRAPRGFGIKTTVILGSVQGRRIR
jgi:hypothetical protein